MRWMHPKAIALVAIVHSSDPARTLQGVHPLERALHAQTKIDEALDHCSADPLGIGTDPSIIATERGFALRNVPIRFIGCLEGAFQTDQDDSTPNDVGFQVFYHIDKRAARKAYIAAVVHELGHVFQTVASGSIGALEDKYCVERIELGADFLAGFSYKNYIQSKSLPDFENSLALFGDFDLRDNDFHGSPADRIDSFRLGYFYTTWHGRASVREAYARFQGFDLPQMLFREAGQNGRCDI